MTETDYLALPSREQDAIADAGIFGIEWVRHERVRINGEWREGETWLRVGADPAKPPPGTYVGFGPAARTTDISAAWEVVEKMDEEGWRATIVWDDKRGGAMFETGDDNNPHPGAYEYADAGQLGTGESFLTTMSAPLAICIAALRAKGVIE